MKIKTFNQFKINEGHKVYDYDKLDIEYETSSSTPVQLDIITIEVSDDEYMFEIHNTEGDYYIKPENDWLNDQESFPEYVNTILNDNGSLKDCELKDFLSVDGDYALHEYEEIDGFDITIIDFYHTGGYEEGFIGVSINGESIGVEFVENVGNDGFDVEDINIVEGEEVIKKHGIDIKDFFHSHLHQIYQKNTGD